jgi:hypothetical protein
MCDLIGPAIDHAIERRCLLGGAGASVLAVVFGTPPPLRTWRNSRSELRRQDPQRGRSARV